MPINSKHILEKLEIFSLQKEGVHASELLRISKFNDMVTTLKK